MKLELQTVISRVNFHLSGSDGAAGAAKLPFNLDQQRYLVCHSATIQQNAKGKRNHVDRNTEFTAQSVLG